MDLTDALRWVVAHTVLALVLVVVLLIAYRLAVPAIHRVVPGVLRAQASHLPAGMLTDAEVSKRVATIEGLLLQLLRAALLAGLVAVMLAAYDLWSLLAGIVLLVAAVMVASQDVVLDYVMGFLILVEGPYFKGDWISVSGQTTGFEGEVQEIGLRRTVLRDNTGAVNAVSNGLIRASSNVTRVFSMAVVELAIPRAVDLEPVLRAGADVVTALKQDPAWSARIEVDTPTDVWVTGLGVEGPGIRIQQRVAPGARMAVASEMRRRLAVALQEAGIATTRWEAPTPVALSGERRSG
ncbi:MAG: mechanosensitive ion channel [Chloroflexota bacterium]